MRQLCIIFVFQVFIYFSSNGQEPGPSVFHIRSLPPEGTLLNKEWRFRASDSMIFANPDYDDRDWKSIDPTMDILKSDLLKRTGINWLRLQLSIDSSLLYEDVAAVIEQYGASEWYLNGKLIYKFGTLSQNEKEVLAYNPMMDPVSMSFDKPGRQVLSVRFAFEKGINYQTGGAAKYSLVIIRLFTFNDAYKEAKKIINALKFTNTFRVGMYFIIALLHLAFFIYKPAKKAYLFFFFYAMFAIVADALQLKNIPEVGGAFNLIKLYFSLWRVSSIFLLTALYFLLNQKIGLIYWILVGLAGFGMFLNNWNFNVLVVDILISIELVRTGLKALRLHTRGAWIITAGAVSYMIFDLLFLVGVIGQFKYYYWPLGQSFKLADLIYAFLELSFPIATTIYIALEFAFTSQSLAQNLKEVKELSRKTLDQELEKQEILSQANKTLEERVETRTLELEKSLQDLKSTQSQLIQSEKMASLGELTAGIAHEIQNPLNFVNNFSEVNVELTQEMLEAIENGKLKDVRGLAEDIRSNGEKIHEHGKRADAIVKSMLQHSRSSNGQKETQDVNKLVDEYVRMAYHGFRAREKDFNAVLDMDFDPHAGSASIIAQDIGRVMLNVLNNAFYAVAEKSKSQGTGFSPLVKVITKRKDNKVEIAVMDNGNGIPKNVLDKVFQPFFTTKPTGQGTGLGLSLSYDIVKAHGGELKVETKEGEGSIFIVQFPGVLIS